MSVISSPSSQRAPAETSKVAIVAVIVFLLIILGGIYLWRAARLSAASMSYPRPPVEVSALRVAAETLPLSLDATGSLQAVREVTLAPEVGGRVTAIRFAAGDVVPAGKPLVQLFDGPERADRAAAVARLGFARLQDARSRELAATGAEPRQLLQQRDAERAQAEAAVQQIDARLAQKSVRAPFAGRIGLRRVNPGQYLNPGDPIATLTALDRLYVNFGVPQQALSALHVGGAITVHSDAVPHRPFDARINAIEPIIGNDTRNVSVQAEMDNPGGVLRPGLYVTVGIAQPPRTHAILIPSTAIATSASGDSVFVVRAGKATLVPVTLGGEVGDRTLVDHGLSPGDVVVTTGLIRLQPGAPVKVVAAAAAAAH